MVPPVESHDVYAHIRVLIGVVLALGLTHILAGIGRMVQHPERWRLWPAHLLWVAIVLLSAIHFWWWEFALIRVEPWRFELFLFVLVYAFLFYLLANLLFPADMGEFKGFEDYFMARRRWFFGLFAATLPMDLIDTLVKGRGYFESLGPEYPIRLAAMLILCGIAARTANRRFHLLFAAGYLVYLLSWILRVYRVL
jgi:hypothetical protein